MKWKPMVGLALALAGWTRFSEDLPPRPGPLPKTYGPPEPEPEEPALPPPPPRPTCPRGETAHWDDRTRAWYCAPKGFL